MLKPADHYFMLQPEPAGSCLLAMRTLILQHNASITEAWKYGMPFYCFGGKMFCYLWTHRKWKQPYLGIVEGDRIHHPLLIKEKRARMKILLIDPSKALPVKTIAGLLENCIALYNN